ncbi:MAG: MarR family winged helix-turn-helix transcriptional regulator [Acetatifactor sp.]
MDRKTKYISFTMRVIHNQVKDIISKTVPKSDFAPQTQLQGGIMGYLFHHSDSAVYQRDIEKEFRISRATATNTLQVMEKRGLIVRRSLDKDARLKRITMTEAAATNHARVEEHMRMMNERMLQGMTPEEIAQFGSYLERVMKNLEVWQQELGSEEAQNALSGKEVEK